MESGRMPDTPTPPEGGVSSCIRPARGQPFTAEPEAGQAGQYSSLSLGTAATRVC